VHQALVVALEHGCDALEIFDVVALGPVGGALVALHLGGLVDKAAMFHIRAPSCLCVSTNRQTFASQLGADG
jgi:hypothetical protein